MTKFSKSDVVFFDLLTNFIFILIILIIYLMLIINHTKKEDVKVKAEYLIVMDWEDDSPNDIDLWLQAANGTLIYFRNNHIQSINLDLDDRGILTDSKNVHINREIITIRSNENGLYKINAHMYSKRDNENVSNNVNIQVLKLNPFKKIFEKSFIMSKKGQVERVGEFTISNEKVVDTKNTTENLVTKILSDAIN